MFKRLLHLKISLAAKCQLLFGAAAIAIIGAALVVPWLRIEQLMGHMNKRAAKTLAEWAEMDHIGRMAGRAAEPARATTGPSTRPTTAPASATAAATRPAQPALVLPWGPRDRASVRLVSFRHDPADLTKFEAKAMEYYRSQADPEPDPVYKMQSNKEGPTSFKYARPVYAHAVCMSCHQADAVWDQPAEAGRRPAPRSAAQKIPPVLGFIAVEIPSQIDANQVFLNRLFIFSAGLLAGTVAIIVFSLITTRLILSPVRVLQDAAEKVSEGDLKIRSDISTGDEFQQLSETFNRMLVNLQETEDQLRAINKNLDLKLGQLSETNVALYESNRLKSEFLANVSHELRTPLNSILGFADLLKDAGLSEDPKALRYLQNIINSGRHLLGLITDLLDLAKIEAGKMEVRSEPLSVADLLEGLIGIIKPLAERKQLAVVTAVGSDVPIVQTDPAKLQQILYNFLSNAIKFSPESGRIDVKAERFEDEHVRISVTDAGPGIEPAKQALIFEKFRQIDGSVTREHGGTGLGLAISKELTVLLGGSIGVHSRPNEGATFWVVLPLRIEAGSQMVMTRPGTGTRV